MSDLSSFATYYKLADKLIENVSKDDLAGQRCMIPFRCVKFISGVDQVFRTLILPAMAAHFDRFLAYKFTSSDGFCKRLCSVQNGG